MRPSLLRPQKKRALILFELLIALSLTAILLTFLFSFFVESAKIEKKLQTARMAISNRAHLQTRLQTILCSVDRSSLEPYFYTQQFEKEPSLSLVLRFDNGIDPDPMYSGSVIGRIFIDSEDNLCLAIWPVIEPKKAPWRKEILFPSAHQLEFEFLGPNSASDHGKKEVFKALTPTLAWRTRWPKSQKRIPSMIRLKIFPEKKPFEFAFILPTSEALVTYTEKAL